MRNITRASIALIGAVALTGATAMSASAETESTDTLTTASVAAGLLTISVPGELALTSDGPGDAAAGQVTVTVTDNTASSTGWETSIAVTDFEPTTAAGGTTIPADQLTYTAAAATTTGSAVVPVVTRGGTDGVVVPEAAGTSVAVQTATTAGNNVATWTAALSLAVPLTAIAGAYEAQLTHSVLY